MEKQSNCPYCGRAFLIRINLPVNDLYLLPNQTHHWKSLLNTTFNKNEYFVKEANCPYCNRKFTVLGLSKPLEKFKWPPIMRLLLFKRLLTISRWKVNIPVIPLSLFFAMLGLYYIGALPVNFLLAVLLISIVFLHRAVKTFESFNIFKDLPLGLSEEYLNRNSQVLNQLFVRVVVHSIWELEILLVVFSVLLCVIYGHYSLFLLMISTIIAVFILYPIFLPLPVLDNISMLLDAMPYVINFEKGTGFEKLGMFILNLLAPGLTIAFGLALFLLITRDTLSDVLGGMLEITLLLGFISFDFLIKHHKRVKQAKALELSKLQKRLQEEYVALLSGSSSKFLEIKSSIDAIHEINEWPRSFKYIATLLTFVFTTVLSSLIHYFLGI